MAGRLVFLVRMQGRWAKPCQPFSRLALRVATATGKTVMKPVTKPATRPAGVSVVICCYNSAARLPETLKHLARQVVPPSIPWEGILVNKASRDDTTDVAARVWKEGGAPAPMHLL